MKVSRELVATLKDEGFRIALAESCTGGMLAAALTAVPGSSEVFDRGFVTYSNESKHEMLGVAKALLQKHGAVSAEVAVAMAAGAIRNSRANLAIAITGIAGPGGGSAKKPVGLVYIACAMKQQKPFCARFNFGNLGRSAIRKASTEAAISLLKDLAQLQPPMQRRRKRPKT